MRKFPEAIATRQDVENIINNHPEYHTQLKEILNRAYNEPGVATQVTSYSIDPNTNEMEDIISTEVIKKTMKYKELGFCDKNELKSTIDKCDLLVPSPKHIK